jgi:hypothetical protein
MSFYSGKSKIAFCHRLGKDWQELAICLDIPAHRRNQFQQGHECYAILEWLAERNESHQKLSEALKVIERKDLLSVLQFNNVDDLRPHLPNRRPQERKLGKAIHTHHDKHRPLLCLIHSDERQCSGRFVDRLAKFYLPKVVPGDGITPYFVHCNFSEDIDLQQEISEQLASSLKINPFATRAEIVDAIIRERSPIIFYTDMCTKNWSRCGEMKLVHNFIEFWAKLELPSTHSHLLLICLYFNYKDIEPSHFLTRWFKRWLRFKKKSINDQIREEFKQLEDENFAEKFGVNGVVLPELMSIEKEDVEAWAREHLHSVLDRVTTEINKLFKSPDETKAMCDLANQLREILEEFPPEIFKA